jgi:hypothetical protein
MTMRSTLRPTAALLGAILAAALLCAGCPKDETTMTSWPDGDEIVEITPVHEHSPDCGHFMVWYGGHTNFYVDGRWEYYSERHKKWVAYKKAPRWLVWFYETRSKERMAAHGK